ncbi:hypothetical protein A2U01_0059898, partial [Trifolium medium]|nr:hypothetical protein [Trifolium medium]
MWQTGAAPSAPISFSADSCTSYRGKYCNWRPYADS